MKKFLVFSVLMIAHLLIISPAAAYEVSKGSADLLDEIPSVPPHQGVSILSGRVVETMDSSGYTYVKIEKEGKTTWVAVSQMEVQVGQEISFVPGMIMKNFRSNTLDRTFDTIIFSEGVAGEAAGESTDTPRKAPGGDLSSQGTVNVQKASGPNAYTVEELHEKSTELDDKVVVFRGRVVKFSTNIMGKNWIHVQDGSGSPSKGTHDILVTSQDILSVGDIVTLVGTLQTDRDFGEGYNYAVIVEQARIKE